MLATMTITLQTISSILEAQAMDRDRIKAAVAQLLLGFGQESDEDYLCRELVQTPLCSLDLETYGLLVERTGGSGYPKVFTDAVRTMKTIVTEEQLHQVIAIVKAKRSGANHKALRAKLVKSEWEWVEQTANTMRIKPSRILEAVLFLYLRAEGKAPLDQ